MCLNQRGKMMAVRDPWTIKRQKQSSKNYPEVFICALQAQFYSNKGMKGGKQERMLSSLEPVDLCMGNKESLLHTNRQVI